MPLTEAELRPVLSWFNTNFWDPILSLAHNHCIKLEFVLNGFGMSQIDYNLLIKHALDNLPFLLCINMFNPKLYNSSMPNIFLLFWGLGCRG